MNLQEIMMTMKEQDMTQEERERFLRKNRGTMLGQIHTQQQLLDKLDYLLHKQEQVRREK